MAESAIVNPNQTYQVETGISNVTAKKSGRTVLLAFFSVNCENMSNGWQSLGTLSTEIRPVVQVVFCCADNDANTYNTNIPLTLRLDTNGELFVYVFSDHKSFSIRGSVTYLTA